MKLNFEILGRTWTADLQDNEEMKRFMLKNMEGYLMDAFDDSIDEVPVFINGNEYLGSAILRESYPDTYEDEFEEWVDCGTAWMFHDFEGGHTLREEWGMITITAEAVE